MNKKMIAPIVVAVILVMYYVGVAVVFGTISDIPLVGKIAMIIVPFILSGVMIYVLVERLKEIKDGEEDDLSKY